MEEALLLLIMPCSAQILPNVCGTKDTVRTRVSLPPFCTSKNFKASLKHTVHRSVLPDFYGAKLVDECLPFDRSGGPSKKNLSPVIDIDRYLYVLLSYDCFALHGCLFTTCGLGPCGGQKKA